MKSKDDTDQIWEAYINEGWRSAISKNWDQDHGARGRGFGDHEAEQQHLGDEEAAKQLGVDLESYKRAQKQAEQQGKSVEDVLAGWKESKELEKQRNDPENQRRSAAARHEERMRSGYYKRNGLVPYQDENGVWTYRSKDHRETGSFRDNPNDLEGRAWD